MATQVDPKADADELEQLGLIAPQQPSMADRHHQGLRRLSPDLIAKASDETATQVVRIGWTFVATAAFCLLSLLSPDSALLGGSKKINVPLAGPVSFFGFMLLGPTILIVLRTYLQIYVEHNDRLNCLAKRLPMHRAPTLLPLKNPLIRVFSGLTFYLLLPVALLVFTWKAAVFPTWGSGLLCVATGVIVSHAVLPFSRCSWRSRVLLSLSGALLVGGIFTGRALLGFEPWRRPFNLFHATLSDQFLAGDDLRGADLTLSNLRGAYLFSANLSGANVFEANLSNADLSGANLTGANIIGANLTRADLTQANLTAADLGEANLTGANLTAADLTGADLIGVNFSYANLSAAHLTGANIIGADLTGADLTEANLSKADLSGAHLSTANLSKADLSGAHLSTANLSNANLSDAHLTGVDLSYADLTGAHLTGVDLSYADLTGAHLTGVDLSYTNLSGANLSYTNLSGVNFSYANLSAAHLSAAHLTGVDLSYANLGGADLSYANLSGANLISARGLTPTLLNLACGSADTKLPDGIAIKPCPGD